MTLNDEDSLFRNFKWPLPPAEPTWNPSKTQSKNMVKQGKTKVLNSKLKRKLKTCNDTSFIRLLTVMKYDDASHQGMQARALQVLFFYQFAPPTSARESEVVCPWQSLSALGHPFFSHKQSSFPTFLSAFPSQILCWVAKAHATKQESQLGFSVSLYSFWVEMCSSIFLSMPHFIWLIYIIIYILHICIYIHTCFLNGAHSRQSLKSVSGSAALKFRKLRRSPDSTFGTFWCLFDAFWYQCGMVDVGRSLVQLQFKAWSGIVAFPFRWSNLWHLEALVGLSLRLCMLWIRVTLHSLHWPAINTWPAQTLKHASKINDSDSECL